MKTKNIFRIFGLGLFALSSIGAGLALSHGQKLQENKADSGDWLCCSTLDLNTSETSIPTYPGFDSDSILFRCWKDGDGTSVREFSMHQTGVSNVFMVIAKFPSTYTFDKIQFRYTESSGDKYSTVYHYEVNSTTVNKNIRCFNWLGGWTGDQWNLSLSDYLNPAFKAGGATYYLTPDADNNRFVAEDVELVNTEYSNFYLNNVNNGYVTMLDTNSLSYYSYWGTTWAECKKDATVDVILDNHYFDNGVVHLKEKQTENSHIYFVSQSDDDDNSLYAYTFGENEHFGSWPGTYIDDSLTDGCEYVDLRNGFKFQGQNHRVYRINVTTGYPADDHIIFSNGESSNQSEDLLLKPGAAYWKGAPAESYNMEAGIVLDLFFDLQIALKDASPYGDLSLTNSVCGINQATAASLYNRYAALSEEDKTTYVNSSSIRTYTGEGAYTSYISADQIFAQLGIIGNVIPASGSRVLFNNSIQNYSFIIIVVSISVISLAGLTFILIIKKRKHN